MLHCTKPDAGTMFPSLNWVILWTNAEHTTVRTLNLSVDMILQEVTGSVKNPYRQKGSHRQRPPPIRHLRI